MRREKEEQAQRKIALMAQESKATSTDELEKLLSETDKWFTNAPKNAHREPEMQAMYQRALKKRELAHVQAEKLTALLSVNVDDLDSLEGLHAFVNQLSALSKLVPMDNNAVVHGLRGHVADVRMPVLVVLAVRHTGPCWTGSQIAGKLRH